MGSADYNQLRELLILDAAIEHVGVRRPRTVTPRLITIAIAKRKKECMPLSTIVPLSTIMIIEFEFVHLHSSLRDASQTRLVKRLILLPAYSARDQRRRRFRR